MPKINFCILCEAARPEPLGKANILGFYGVLPHAALLVNLKAPKPVQSLVFLLGVSGESQAFSLSASILNPDGSPLAVGNSAEFPPIEGDGSALCGLGFNGVPFVEKGAYPLQVFVNGQEAYKQTFTIDQDKA
jgi:hypothetical protein